VLSAEEQLPGEVAPRFRRCLARPTAGYPIVAQRQAGFL